MTRSYIFTNRLAVVTGGSEGIGLAISTALARCGARVVLLARGRDKLQQAVNELKKSNLDAQFVVCDLSDLDAIEVAFKTIQERHGTVDILVNNAGQGTFGPLIDASAAELEAGLNVPVKAAIFASRAVLPAMQRQGDGHIINVLTPASYFPLPFMAPYTASRWALNGFSQALYHEVKSSGVHVGTVCPAKVNTEYLANNNADIAWWPRIASIFPVLSAQTVADRVVAGIEFRKQEQIFPWLLWLFVRVHALFPKLVVFILERLKLFQPNRQLQHSITAADATNWEESINLDASVVEYPKDVHAIQEIVKNTDQYPSPVRTAGSRHSTTHCGVADQGTLLITRHMHRILAIDSDEQTVTAEAGAYYIDVAKALELQGLQFYVNVEIGNLTMGSAACTGTKDASFAGEMGQVCSYLVAAKMVCADGSVLTVTENEPDLLRAVRSSYGLLGVVYEVTFRIKKLQAMSVRHERFSVDEFERALPNLLKKDDSMMYYLFPFDNTLAVEFRRYDENRLPSGRKAWFVRNLAWKTIAPAVSALATRWIKNKSMRFWLIDTWYRLLQLILVFGIKSNGSFAADQIIRYPEKKGLSKYTFSIWAFPEDRFVETLRAFYRFCQDYYRDTGYRCDILNVGYRIGQDQKPMFSYSWHGNVMTLDPVCTANEPGWDDFLRSYNDFCSSHGGYPLFNQSKWLSTEHAQKAFGDRIAQFNPIRRKLDPGNRFQNAYFDSLFETKAKLRAVPKPAAEPEPSLTALLSKPAVAEADTAY